MQKNNDVLVLNAIYRGAETGAQAISDLMPKAEDTAFRAELDAQAREFRSIASEAAVQLAGLNASPKPVGYAKKTGMKMAVEMNAMADPDLSHYAEMMIKGSHMGILNMTKVMNDYAEPRPEIRELGDRLIKAEQQHVEQLKKYL